MEDFAACKLSEGIGSGHLLRDGGDGTGHPGLSKESVGAWVGGMEEEP